MDAALAARISAKIRAFDEANLAIAMTYTSIIRSLGARARYSVKAEGGVVLNARLAATVKEAVGQ